MEKRIPSPQRSSRSSDLAEAREGPAAITRAAILASGVPIALATNGTVRLARRIHLNEVVPRRP